MTWFNYDLKLIEWHVDWIFVNSNNLKLSESGVAENIRLVTTLEKYLNKIENEDLQEKLQFYQAVGLPGIRLLLKAEQKRGGRKFYEIESSDTLRECLKNKLVIEYPTIHVVLKDQADFYDIIDSGLFYLCLLCCKIIKLYF